MTPDEYTQMIGQFFQIGHAVGQGEVQLKQRQQVLQARQEYLAAQGDMEHQDPETDPEYASQAQRNFSAAHAKLAMYDPQAANAMAQSRRVQFEQQMQPYQLEAEKAKAHEASAKMFADQIMRQSGAVQRVYGSMRSTENLPTINEYLSRTVGVDPSELANKPEDIAPVLQHHATKIASVSTPEYTAETKDAIARFIPPGTPMTPQSVAEARRRAEKEKSDIETQAAIAKEYGEAPVKLAVAQAGNPSYIPGPDGGNLSLGKEQVRELQNKQIAAQIAQTKASQFLKKYGAELQEVQSIGTQGKEELQRGVEFLFPGSNTKAVYDAKTRKSDLEDLRATLISSFASARGIANEKAKEELKDILPGEHDSGADITGAINAILGRTNDQIGAYQQLIRHGTSMGASGADIQPGQKPGGKGVAPHGKVYPAGTRVKGPDGKIRPITKAGELPPGFLAVQ